VDIKSTVVIQPIPQVEKPIGVICHAEGRIVRVAVKDGRYVPSEVRRLAYKLLLEANQAQRNAAELA